MAGFTHQCVGRHRAWAQTITDETLATLVVAGLDAHVGVDVDAVYFDETRAEPHWQAGATVSQPRGAVVSEGAG